MLYFLMKAKPTTLMETILVVPIITNNLRVIIKRAVLYIARGGSPSAEEINH